MGFPGGMDGIARCRSCAAPIWWRKNPSGKAQPMDFDLATMTRTETPHHATCPMAKEWRGRTRHAQPERATELRRLHGLPFDP